MSKNPIDAYLMALGGLSEEKLSENPIDAFIAGGFKPSALVERRESGLEQFGEGVGSGLIYPIRSLAKPQEADNLAGMAGELVGMGLSFVPLFRGARVVTAGIGALQTAPKLRQVVEGSLSFAGFEALAGESPSDAPLRIARGLAEGAVFEVALMGAIAKWRSRFPDYVEDLRKAGEAITPPPDVAIHPDALKIERWFAPGDEPFEATVAKLKAVQDPQANLHQALVRITNAHMPGGQIILPGMEDLQGIKTVADELGLKMAVYFDTSAGKLSKDVLLVNPQQTLLRIKDPKLRKKFLGEGLPVLSYEEAIKVIEETGEVEIQRVQSLPGALGRFQSVKVGHTEGPLPRIQMWEPNSPEAKLETLVHEYMHFLHDREAPDIYAPLDVLFKIRGKADDVRFSSINGEENREFFSLVAKLETVRSEMKKVTEEVRTHLFQRNGLTPATARVEAQREIQGNLPYFHSDFELVARMAEYMFINPKRAREIAPRATRLVAGLVVRRSPTMKELMSKELNAVDDFFKELWVRRGKELTIWERGAPRLTDRDIRQFGKTGFFPGMQVFVDGKEAEFVAKVGAKDVAIRWSRSGKTEVVELGRTQRPLVPVTLKRQEEVIREIDAAIDGQIINGRPGWVAVNLRDFGDPATGSQGAIRRAVVDLTDFEFVTNLRKWKKGLSDEEREFFLFATRQQIVHPVTGRARPRLLDHRGSLIAGEDAGIEAIMKLRGKKGLAIYDNGRFELVVADQSAVKLGEQAGIAHGSTFGGPEEITGLLHDGFVRHIVPSPDETLRAMLREKGVMEHDLPYFMNLTRQRYAEKLRGLADSDTRQIYENVEVAVASKAGDEGVEGIASRAGIEQVITNDSRVELRDVASKSVLGRFPDEESASRFVERAGIDDGAPPIADFPGGNSAGGNGRPPRPQEQLPQGGDDLPIRRDHGGFSRLVDAQSLFGALFTAMENFAKAAENRGLGAAFSKIFNPAQLAILEVDRQLAGVKRELLGGVSFSEGLQKLEKHLRGVKSNRQPIVTQWVEYMSKEEIAKPGGLLQRGMTENEIRIANYIESVGLQNDIPRLLAVRRLIQTSLKSEQALDDTLFKLRQHQTSPEVQQLIRVFESMPRFKTADEVMEFLKLTNEEKQVLKILEDSFGASKDKFSIFAVSRYASARPLGKGFKSGREQFAVEHKMTKDEIAAGKQIDKILEAAFGLSGIEAKRQIGGYWPHMRMWAQYGWTPRGVGKYGLPDEMIEWSHQRFRTGELDIYNMDPLITTFKYVRGMLMKQHFDPILPDIVKELRVVRQRDRRTFEILAEYIEELKGRPHSSFGRAQAAIAGGLRALTGAEPSPALVEHTVNSLAALAAAAAIPFRPALIIRNWFESLQKIAPRVGMRHYLQALSYVTNPKTKAEAYEAARKARAITEGPQAIRSIHASTEVFGPTGSKFNYRLERMLEKGFKWYQSSDDFGRAIAHHAQRLRMAEHYGDYVRGRIDLDTYLERAKILTFDPVDIAEAERLIKAGDLEGAQNYLGRTLARETMNRYGHANHPAGWNSVVGRLFGQFGTWPVQYKDFLLQGLSRGTTKDRVEFAMTHFGVMGGTLVGGEAVGLNLMSWIGFPSLAYTGGPFTDLTIDVARSISGSDTEKALARRNLIAQIPVWGWMETGRPNSIFVPGSYLLGDIAEAMQAEGLLEATLLGTGFNIIKPQERTALEWVMEF